MWVFCLAANVLIVFSSWRNTLKRLEKFWGHRTTSWPIIPIQIYTSKCSQHALIGLRYFGSWMRLKSLNFSFFSHLSSQHPLWTGGIWWIFLGEWPLLGVQQSWSALLCEWHLWHVTYNGCLSCYGSKCWPTLFPVLLEHQTLIYQSGHTLHHHSASGEADWQPHYQQSHCEDWRS